MKMTLFYKDRFFFATYVVYMFYYPSDSVKESIAALSRTKEEIIICLSMYDSPSVTVKPVLSGHRRGMAN